jgi:hypothetical protein
MLSNLKKEIKRQENTEAMLESMVAPSRAEESIRNAILGDVRMDVLGAENDPEIKALVENVPEYDDHDEDVEMEIASMTEALAETEL